MLHGYSIYTCMFLVLLSLHFSLSLCILQFTEKKIESWVCCCFHAMFKVSFIHHKYFLCCVKCFVDQSMYKKRLPLCFRLWPCREWLLYKERMLSFSSLISCRNLSHPWRYLTQTKCSLCTFLLLLHGYLTLNYKQQQKAPQMTKLLLNNKHFWL